MNNENAGNLERSGNGFTRIVLIDGVLKIGMIAFSVGILVDFLVRYGFTGEIPRFPGNYYFRSLMFGLSMGAVVGALTWIYLRRTHKNPVSG